MRLWTLQPVEYYNSCKGIIKPDPAHMELLTEDWDMKFQYDWMCEQMRKRLPRYNGGYPVWLYPEKPDMRQSMWGPRGSKEVRLECEVPDELVLLSDYDLWHFPLNWGYIPTSKEDDDRWDEEVVRRTGSQFTRYPDLPKDMQERMLDSWERIFPDRRGEIDETDEYMSVGEPYWQATVEEIPKEWILSESYHTLR